MMSSMTFYQLFRKGMAVLLCCLLLQTCFISLPASAETESLLTPDAAGIADILGVRKDAEDIIVLRKSGDRSDSARNQLNVYRSRVLRKIFQGLLEVQNGENKLEVEIAYTYDVLAREQRKQSNINELFNLANFLQFGTLYTIEPFLRIHKKFNNSAILTCVGAGLGLGLPIINIIYNKYAKASHLTPPAFLSHLIDGKPVDGTNMPPLVMKYLDQKSPGTDLTRREALNALWKQRYSADMNKKETLAGINDGKPKSTVVLNNRIVLLWSLFTTIQQFDSDLLSLLQQVRDDSLLTAEQTSSTRISTTGLSGGAAEAVRLLRLERVVSELKELSAENSDSIRKMELQVTFLETLIAGCLEMQIAANRCQSEMNYQIDVVLASLLARRGKFLQKTYEANFIQTNSFGAVAGYSYLKHHTNTGNEMFLIGNSIGIGLTTVSLIATHGGWRKNATPPNSLAAFFELEGKGKYGLSTLVWNYLNSPSPDSPGKTRRQYLKQIWTDNQTANVDLKKPGNLEKLGSMPSCKYDTIKIVTNRISLLSSLRDQFMQFDSDILDLHRKVWPATVASDPPEEVIAKLPLDASAKSAAKLLGMHNVIATSLNDKTDQVSKLMVTGSILEGYLETTADANLLGLQIVKENEILRRMTRTRDAAIQFTNIANFYQIGVLGSVFDCVGLSKNKSRNLSANRINITTGLMVSSFALLAAAERRGGFRPGKAMPNALSTAFAKKSNYVTLSPVTMRYLNSVSPVASENLTRREELMKYWTESKVLSVNIEPDSMKQKLSAEGEAHHWWNESIKLINNRIFMLYDLRAILRTSNSGFGELLGSVD